MREKTIIQKLLSIYKYDPESGRLFSQARKRWLKPSKDGKGYYKIGITLKKYGWVGLSMHRAVYAMYHGYFPELQIDHINRDKTDNRIENLREASATCQNRNKANQVNNTSGVKGVYFQAKANKWHAKIKVDGDWKYLGIHKDFMEAVCHRRAAEQCLNWSNCDTNSPARIAMLVDDL